MSKGIDIKQKEQNGIRPGIEREKLIKSLNEEDWDKIKLMKEIKNTFAENKTVFDFAVRTDQMYQQFLETIDALDGNTANLLMTKVRIEKNIIDILKGDTDRTFGNTGNKLSIRDLEIENINLNRTINKDLRNIYLLITDIYRHVDKKRIDKKIYFTTKQFEEKVQLLKNEFKKNNIEIFKD
jgi:hypothetical protein